MSQPDQTLTAIARDKLGITTLETRQSDRLDFHDLAVWNVAAALKAAYDAGAASVDAARPPHPAGSSHSPAPWDYEFSPYTVRVAGDGDPDPVGKEIPAFEVFDAEGNKVFDTNEDTPSERQEANARLGAAAPKLLAALNRCAMLLADYDEQEGEEGEAYVRRSPPSPPRSHTGGSRDHRSGRNPRRPVPRMCVCRVRGTSHRPGRASRSGGHPPPGLSILRGSFGGEESPPGLTAAPGRAGGCSLETLAKPDRMGVIRPWAGRFAALPFYWEPCRTTRSLFGNFPAAFDPFFEIFRRRSIRSLAVSVRLG